MNLYDILLGIDHAARDTGRRIQMRVCERDSLAAALKAERLADMGLDDPETEYSHAMRVRPVCQPLPSVGMALAA